jgi:RecA-family ATPase
MLTVIFSTEAKPARRPLMSVDDESGLALPPHSREAEQSVIGALLIDNTVANDVLELLHADDFYNGAHREIFRHIATLCDAGLPMDTVTVCESLQRTGKLEYVGGLVYVGSLAQQVPTAANASHYAGIVKERAQRRAIMAIAIDIGAAAASSGEASGSVLRNAQERLDTLARASPAVGPFPLDLKALANAPAPERRFRVGKIMPIGVPGLFAGHGGAGKTQLALHLAICIALERPFFGEVVQGGTVAMVSTEDDQDDLHYRLEQQVRTLGASIEDLAGRLWLYDLTRTDPLVLVTDASGKVTATPLYAKLREEFRRHQVDVAILDNFATMCAVDLISPGDVTAGIAELARILPSPDGNLIVLSHVNKVTAIDGYSPEAYTGTAAFNNRMRWRWAIMPLDGKQSRREDDAEGPAEGAARADPRRILEVQKINAGRVGARIALRFTDAGAIIQDGVDDGISARILRGREREGVLEAMRDAARCSMHVPAARTGPLTSHHVLAKMPNYPETLGRKALFDLLLKLEAAGEIEHYSYRNHGRKVKDAIRIAVPSGAPLAQSASD